MLICIFKHISTIAHYFIFAYFRLITVPVLFHRHFHSYMQTKATTQLNQLINPMLIIL